MSRHMSRVLIASAAAALLASPFALAQQSSTGSSTGYGSSTTGTPPTSGTSPNASPHASPSMSPSPSAGSTAYPSTVVREAQQALQARGFPVGAVDGQMSPNTQEALRDFQRRNGLSATGELNQETLAALNINTSGTGSAGNSPSGSPSGMGTSSGSSTGSGGSMTTPPATR